MFPRLHFPVCVLLAGVGLSLSPLALRAQSDNYRGRKYKVPPPSAHIEVTVLKDFNGKPIENAHVIFHPTQGDKDTGSLELKTNEDGKAIIDVIPLGDTVTLQVIANGYQTYGQSFKIDKPELTMEVRMKRPGAQYSIYKNSGAGGGSGSSSPSPNATPPASGNQSNPSQPQPK